MYRHRLDGECVGMLQEERSLIKLHVRQAGANRFLDVAGRWTRKVKNAFNFPHLLQALNACLAKGLKEVEFVMRFEGDWNDRCYPANMERLERAAQLTDGFMFKWAGFPLPCRRRNLARI